MSIHVIEQDIRRFKADLGQAMTGLADVRNRALRTRSEAEKNRRLADDYEKQAIKHLRELRDGRLDRSEADRLATQALVSKTDHSVEAEKMEQSAARLDETVKELEAGVNEIKATIKNLENELLTLKARSRAADAAARVGETLAGIDTARATSLLEKMKDKVVEEEALAQAYGQMAPDEKRVRLDEEIAAALGEDPKDKAVESLNRLKKDLGIS